MKRYRPSFESVEDRTTPVSPNGTYQAILGRLQANPYIWTLEGKGKTYFGTITVSRPGAISPYELYVVGTVPNTQQDLESQQARLAEQKLHPPGPYVKPPALVEFLKRPATP